MLFLIVIREVSHIVIHLAPTGWEEPNKSLRDLGADEVGQVIRVGNGLGPNRLQKLRPVRLGRGLARWVSFRARRCFCRLGRCRDKILALTSQSLQRLRNGAIRLASIQLQQENIRDGEGDSSLSD